MKDVGGVKFQQLGKKLKLVFPGDIHNNGTENNQRLVQHNRDLFKPLFRVVEKPYIFTNFLVIELEVYKILFYLVFRHCLTEKNLAGVINGKNRLAFRAPETAGFKGLEFLGTNGAGKYLWEKGNRLGGGAASEKVD
jgi:hypothetical protein